MSRNGRKTRQEQVENTARIAAEAAAAAVLEAAHEDDDDDDEMEESIQPGDDGRPKTLKGRSVPSAGGPSKDVKLGSEGPDAVKKSRVAENLDQDEDDDDEMEESRLRNPLGAHLYEVDDDEDADDDEEMAEATADDQLTSTDDSSRSDAQRKRQSSTYSGDIGNEVTTKSHPKVPSANAVVEAQMAGEGAKSQTQSNPGRPEDQLTDADNDTGSDAGRAGQRGPKGSGGKPSSGALDAAQSAKERPLDPSAVGMDKTVAEATNALFNGEDLSEEFKTKATTIFNAALREVMTRHAEQMTETYNGFLDEKVAEIQAGFDAKQAAIIERVDDYLGYVVEQWADENKLAIENGLRSEISSSFMNGLHDLFKEHNIELPEDRVDAYVELQTRNEELEGQLGEQINSNVELRKVVNTKTFNEVFDEVADGLADTDRERLRSLAEGLEADDSDQYRDKVEILRESYFGATAVAAASDDYDAVDESNEPALVELNEKMSSYVATAGRLQGHPSATGKFRQGQLNG